MNKMEAVQQLRSAKRAHLSWVMKANALIQGIPLDKEQVPVKSTECKFGQWYHSVANDLIFVPGFHEIEQPHDKLHSIYQDIFTLLIPEEKKGVIARLLGSQPEVSEKNKEKAKLLFQSLKEQSDRVIEYLDKMEQEIPESKSF